MAPTDPEECVDDDNGPWSEDSELKRQEERTFFLLSFHKKTYASCDFQKFTGMNGCDSPPPEEKPDECQPHENDALNPWDEEEGKTRETVTLAMPESKLVGEP